MTAITPEAFFDGDVHFVRLGALRDGGQLDLMLNWQPSGNANGFNLTRWRYEFLKSLDASVAAASRDWTDDEGGLVLSLAENGAIAFVDVEAGTSELNFVPMLRKTILTATDIEDGASIVTTDAGTSFSVNQMGGFLLARIDNMSTLATICDSVVQEVFGGDDGAEFIRENEEEFGKPFDQLLTEEALRLVQTLLTDGIVTFEPLEIA